MAVEKIDVQIQSMLSDAQMRTQKDVGKDDAADAARRAAEKKIAERKASLKASNTQKKVSRRGHASSKKYKISSGAQRAMKPLRHFRTGVITQSFRAS